MIISICELFDHIKDHDHLVFNHIKDHDHLIISKIIIIWYLIILPIIIKDHHNDNHDHE